MGAMEKQVIEHQIVSIRYNGKQIFWFLGESRSPKRNICTSCREANNIKVFGQRNSQTQNEVARTPKHSSHCNVVAVHKGGCTSPLWIQQAAILVETWVELKEGAKKMVCMYICIYVCIYSYLPTYLPKQNLPHLGNDRPLISPSLWLTV